MTLMRVRFLVLALGCAATLSPLVSICGAQTVQNATLRRAQQAFDNLEYRQALSGGQAALRERLTGFARARGSEPLGFSYRGTGPILKGVDGLQQVILLAPARDPDPPRTSPHAPTALQGAL